MRPIDADALIEFCAERWIPLNIDAVNMQPTIQPVATDTNVGDTISRQATIDAVNNAFDRETLLTGFVRSIAVRAIRDMPSVQPEPHEGKWVYGEDSTADCVDGYRCSQCGFFVPWDYNHKLIDYINDYAYCPNCGARMKGEI